MKRWFFILAILFAAQDISFAAVKDSVVQKGVPIILREDTLFYLHAGQRLMTVSERALLIQQRLESMTALNEFFPDSLQVVNDSALSEIVYNSRLLMAVNDSDAIYADAGRLLLAQQYKEAISQSLQRYVFHLAWPFIFKILWQTLTVIAVLILLIYGINRFFRLIRFKLLRGKRFPEIRVKDYSLVTEERMRFMAYRFLKLLRLLIILLLLYIALPILFSIFPWTRDIGHKLIAYIIDPLKEIVLAVIQYIPKLLTILVLYLVTRYVVKSIKFFALEIERGALTINNFYPDWAMPTFKIVKALLYIFMFIIIYPYLPGSDSKVFQGVSVFLGLLLSLGSTSAIANLVAGVVLTYMRPYKIGDRVKIGDVTGDVVEKTLLVTRIRSIKNEEITVPNSTVLSSHTMNYTKGAADEGLLLHTTVTISYDVPWKKVHDLLTSAAQNAPGIEKHPEPFVLQLALNDFYVTYELNAYTRLPNQMIRTYSNLHQQIQDKFFEAGVEIMSPHFSALRDGNMVSVPDEYRPKDYKKPGFKIEKD